MLKLILIPKSKNLRSRLSKYLMEYQIFDRINRKLSSFDLYLAITLWGTWGQVCKLYNNDECL